MLNNQWVTEEIKEDIKKIPRDSENGITMIQSLWDAAKPVLEEVYSNTSPTSGNKINLKKKKHTQNKKPNTI